MKNIFFLMAVVILSSCAKEEVAIPQDQLIGSWTHVQSRYEYQDGTIQINNVSGCSLQSKRIFNANGTFEEINYEQSAITNNCVPQTSGFTGDKLWAKTDNGGYVFNKISTNPNYDSTVREAITAIFQDNTVSLRFQETFTDPSNTNPLLYYTEVYQKN